jgi:hypothetical protein
MKTTDQKKYNNRRNQLIETLLEEINPKGALNSNKARNLVKTKIKDINKILDILLKKVA